MHVCMCESPTSGRSPMLSSTETYLKGVGPKRLSPNLRSLARFLPRALAEVPGECECVRVGGGIGTKPGAVIDMKSLDLF